MTKGDSEIMAENGQTPTSSKSEAPVAAEAPAQQQAALAEAQVREAVGNPAAAQAAAAAALLGAEAPVAEAAELTSAAEAQAQAAAKARAKFDDEKDEDEDAEAEAATEDLAMDPGAEILEAVAAADGARSAQAEGDEALGLGGDNDGAPLLAVAALAAVGAGIYIAVDGGDDDEVTLPLPEPEPEPEPVNVAPVITSGTEVDVDENTDVGEVVYVATATDADGDDITFSILADSDDFDAFTIDPDTGEVRFVASPDFEDQDSFSITIVATDSEGNAASQDVTIDINDVDENVAPVITSDATVDVDENTDVGEVVYVATATDADGDDITFSILADSEDFDAFTIDPDTGEVRFVASPDFEDQDSFSITVVATDSEGNAASQDVTIDINDVDENVAPVITSDATVDVDENTDVGEVVYVATATDADGDDITFSILADSEDFDAFTIDPDTGEVRFVASPDFEDQDSFSITVVATDSEGNAASQDVTIDINDIDEVVNTAPVFVSPAVFAIDENFDENEVAFDVDVTDADGDVVTFTIDGDDADQFVIDPDTGEVRFVASPDFETQDSFNVTVTATDALGNATSQDIVVNINDVDENAAPVFVTPAAFVIDENVDENEVAFDVDVADADDDVVTFAIDGDDADQFVIDPDTGEVRFVASPDFETQDSFNVTVTATDAFGNATSQDIVVTINDLDEPVVVDLDASDSDNNALTAETISAADDDFVFADDASEASFTIIQDFELGDSIVFSEDADVSFSTSADDANDLEITVNQDGVVSIIVLDDVLGDDAGLIFNEATAEAEVGFDFFSTGELPTATPIAAENFA